MCDFETDFCGMTQRKDDDNSWIRYDRAVPHGFGTGPLGPKYGRWFIFVDATYTNGFWVTSPLGYVETTNVGDKT